jgi:hypothetical protein
MTEQFQWVGLCVATCAVKGITLVSSEFAKAPGALAEGSGQPVKKSRGARGGQPTARSGRLRTAALRHAPYTPCTEQLASGTNP